MNTPIRVRCDGCERDAFLNVNALTLMVALRGENGDIYAFTCIHCGCYCRKQSHPWLTKWLLAEQVPTINLADQLAADLVDDDAVEAEMEGWDR